MTSTSAPSSRCLPCLSSCPDVLEWWTVVWKHKTNQLFHFFWLWCFITARVTLTRTERYTETSETSPGFSFEMIKSSTVQCMILNMSLRPERLRKDEKEQELTVRQGTLLFPWVRLQKPAAQGALEKGHTTR